MMGKTHLAVMVILASVIGLTGGYLHPLSPTLTPDSKYTPETIKEKDFEYRESVINFYRAELINKLEIPVGQTGKLESLRQAVVPPYLPLIPFIEVPDEIVIKAQYSLDEDGVHGSIYHLKAVTPLDGKIIVGFRDLQTG